MIKTKAGREVIIVDGSNKSIKGTKPFIVRFSEDLFPKIMRYHGMKPSRFWNKKFKLRRDELLFDSEEELTEALNVKAKNSN